MDPIKQAIEALEVAACKPNELGGFSGGGFPYSHPEQEIGCCMARLALAALRDWRAEGARDTAEWAFHYREQHADPAFIAGIEDELRIAFLASRLAGIPTEIRETLIHCHTSPSV